MSSQIVPFSKVPAPLVQAAVIIDCTKCSRPMFWGRRAGHDARSIAIDAEPNVNGHYLVSAFVLNRFGTAVVPQISDTRDVATVVPDWEQIPSWARKKRWTNHADFCDATVAAVFAKLGGETSRRDLIRRVSLSETRRQQIDGILTAARLTVPDYAPSERFKEACDRYADLKIDKARFETALLQEDERIGAVVKAAQYRDRQS